MYISKYLVEYYQCIDESLHIGSLSNNKIKHLFKKQEISGYSIFFTIQDRFNARTVSVLFVREDKIAKSRPIISVSVDSLTNFNSFINHM